MTFFKSHQKLHIWLLADLVLLAAFWIAREHRDWMNALERFVSAPIRRSLGSLCYRVSFSVMEALYVLAAVLVLAYVVWNITAVSRPRARKRRAYSAVLGAVCAGLERLRRYLPAVGGVAITRTAFQTGPASAEEGIAPGSDGGDRVVRGKSGADSRPGAPG